MRNSLPLFVVLTFFASFVPPAQLLSDDQLRPEEIRSSIFVSEYLVSTYPSTGKKYRWFFREDGWWSRTSVNTSDPEVGGRWRLSADGFCLTPYDFLLGNPTFPAGGESCFTVTLIDEERWGIRRVGSAETAIVEKESATFEAPGAFQNPRWAEAWKRDEPVRAFLENKLQPAPTFTDGFGAYVRQRQPHIISVANDDAVRALAAEPPYEWTFPQKYVSSTYRSKFKVGDKCTIYTIVRPRADSTGVVIERPIRRQHCSNKGVHPSPAHASSDNSRFVVSLTDVTATLRENAVDDTVSGELTTACDLVCRGGANCLEGPNMVQFADGRKAVGHGTASRTSYVGSKTPTSDFCRVIQELQSVLEPIHAKYVASVRLDATRRGACPEPEFSNYPWAGQGKAAKYATVEQVRVPPETCVEKAHMTESFPFQGVMRGEIVLTMRYPVGKWPSCFTDTPLRSEKECVSDAVPVAGVRMMRATIAY